MGLNQTSARGRQQRYYARLETAAGTFLQPRTGDAMRVKKGAVKTSIERVDRSDARQTASRLERITRLKKVEHDAELYVLPSGAAGTAPDCGPLLTGLFGTETVNASTSVVYTLSDSQTIPTYTIVHEDEGVISKAATGCVVKQGKLSFKGGDEPMFSFSGPGMNWIHTGSSTTTGALTYVATPLTSIAIQTADVTQFETNSLIYVGSDTNSGAGHLVTAGGGTATLTISPGVTSSQASGVIVGAYVPTETVAGSPIAGISGSLTLDAVSLPFTEFEVEIDNGFKGNENQAGIAYITDFIRGPRTVKGSFTVRATRDQIIHLAKYKSAPQTVRAISVTVGSAAGYRIVCAVPYAEITVPEIELPEDLTEGTIKMPFEALGSSGADEISLSFT